jgi:hypothetical protein
MAAHVGEPSPPASKGACSSPFGHDTAHTSALAGVISCAVTSKVPPLANPNVEISALAVAVAVESNRTPTFVINASHVPLASAQHAKKIAPARAVAFDDALDDDARRRRRRRSETTTRAARIVTVTCARVARRASSVARPSRRPRSPVTRTRA